MAYAQNTTVSTEKSKLEIEKMLKKYGAKSCQTHWEDGMSIIQCEIENRRVRFTLPLLKVSDPAFSKDGRGTTSPAQRLKLHEQEERRRWRALTLIIKAKLEAIESKIESFDQAFLANIMIPTPDGAMTIGEWAAPGILKAYKQGVSMPPMLGKGDK